jgi:hypothetical protein
MDLDFEKKTIKRFERANLKDFINSERFQTKNNNKKSYNVHKQELLENKSIKNGEWIAFSNNEVKFHGKTFEEVYNQDIDKEESFYYCIVGNEEKSLKTITKSPKRKDTSTENIENHSINYIYKSKYSDYQDKLPNLNVLLNIEIENDTIQLEEICLIDTCATKSCIPFEFLENLSLKDLDECEAKYSNQTLTEVKLKVNIKNSKENFIVPFDVMYDKDWGLDQTPSILLGQKDFLEILNVKFYGKSKEIKFDEISNSQENNIIYDFNKFDEISGRKKRKYETEKNIPKKN